MATHATTLLWPRPDFLGAGRSWETTNIFLELSQLSGLYFNKFCDNFLSDSSGRIAPTTEIAARSKTFSTNIQMTTSPSTASSRSNKRKQTRNQICKSNTEKMLKLDDVSLDYLIKADTIDLKHLEILCKKGKKKYSLKQDVKSGTPLRNHPVHNQELTGKNGYITFNDHTLEIFDIFDKLKIPYDTEIYRPKEQRCHVDPKIFYCKNVFLKDRKGQFYLVICHEDTDLVLKELRKNLKAYRNFNFVTADEMTALIKTEPGGVTPLALLYDTENLVKMVISNTLVRDDVSLMFHPMDSSLAMRISMPSLLRYLRHVNHKVQFIK